MPRVARRHDTVEHIKPCVNSLEHIAEITYSHEISRFIRWQKGAVKIDDFMHFFLGFTNAYTSDRVAVKADVQEILSALFSEGP